VVGPRSLDKSPDGKNAGSQTADCYDYPNSGGDRITVVDYISDLAEYWWDNKVESCCFTGIWLLYDGVNYNSENPDASDWWVYGDNYCTDVPQGFKNKASSIRYTGSPDNWRQDSVNLYFQEYFIGEEEFTYSDKETLNYDNRAQSVLVTGCSPWTLYEFPSFSGRAVCVYPEDSSKCSPGFYSTRQSLGPVAGTVSSVRKGCYARETRRPDNQRLTKGQHLQNGTSGFFPQRSNI